MTRSEICFLIGVVLTVVVTMALIPPNPESQLRLNQPSPVDWAQVQDDPTQTLSLRWQGIIAHSSGQPGSWIERNLEARFALELEPIFMDVNAYSRRRPLMLCGGNIPDVMWSGDPLQVRANLRNGFVMEVPYELILEHCPTYVAQVNTYGKEAWLYSHYQGKNYGLPTINADANRPRISCWRLDWLRNVGIEKVPETIEEAREALYRFRHQDPDGNGKKDTYGWQPAVWHWSLAFVEIFAAYDLLAFDLMLRDGKVVWGGVQPEAKAALAVLRDWYAEELLHPDFPVISQGRDVERAFINGKVGYLHPVDHFKSYDPDEPNSVASKARALDPDAVLVAGPPLRNAAGERRGRTWGGAAHVLQFGRQLEQQPQKVIRVLDMMEAIAKDEVLYMQARYGERGVQWDSSDTDGIVTLPPFKGDSRRCSAELMASTIFFFPCRVEQLYDDKYRAADDREWLERNRLTEWGMMNVLGKSDVIPSAGRYLADLVNYQLTVFTEIVLGDRDLETFDAFVAEWRRRGGDVIEAEANEMYRDVRAIYDRVGVRPQQQMTTK